MLHIYINIYIYIYIYIYILLKIIGYRMPLYIHSLQLLNQPSVNANHSHPIAAVVLIVSPWNVCCKNCIPSNLITFVFIALSA